MLPKHQQRRSAAGRGAPGTNQNLLALARHHIACGNLPQAAAAFNELLKINKNNADALFGLGSVKLNLGDKKRASRHLKNAIRVNPQFAAARFLLGKVLASEESYREAIQQVRHCVRIEPENMQYLRYLADLWDVIHEYRKAAECYERMIQTNPTYAVFHNNLGLINKKLCLIDRAIDSLRHAMELDPSNAIIRSNLLLALNYSPALSRQSIFEEHENLGREFPAAPVAPWVSSTTRIMERRRRLSIGFVSADFREHSVAYFFEPLLGALDRDAFKIFCYGGVIHPDETTARLQSLVDCWRSTVDVSDRDVAAQIRSDQIDILIDLAGHTVGNRLPVFAARAAPVQVTWLGYPNTTGLPEMDFRVTDSVCDPVGDADGFATEKLIRMPDGFLCYRPSPNAPEIAGPPSLTKGFVTFGSFNNPSKINEGVVELWAEIMQRVHNSRFLLKFIGLENVALQEQLRRWFERNHVDQDRLIFKGFAYSKAEHLGLYDDVDIALDTHPYNGTTTTCDALWMGVPVVSLIGDRHAARVGASLLKRVDLPELVAANEEDYIVIAHDLAQNGERLRELRHGLRDRMRRSKLMDEENFARQMAEAFYRMMQSRVGGPATA